MFSYRQRLWIFVIFFFFWIFIRLILHRSRILFCLCHSLTFNGIGQSTVASSKIVFFSSIEQYHEQNSVHASRHARTTTEKRSQHCSICQHLFDTLAQNNPVLHVLLSIPPPHMHAHFDICVCSLSLFARCL